MLELFTSFGVNEGVQVRLSGFAFEWNGVISVFILLLFFFSLLIATRDGSSSFY